MSELGSLLELLHAPRLRSIRASGRQWTHRRRNLEAFWRMAAAHGGNVQTMSASVDGPDEQEPAEQEERWRIWLEPPDRARAEFLIGHEHGPVKVVEDGGNAWIWDAQYGGRAVEGDVGLGPGMALIDPAPILPGVELEIRGEDAFLGRRVIEARAIPVAIDPHRQPHMGSYDAPGHGADEYEFLVDAERGVLLRSEARLEGEPFRIVEMDEVAYDEDFPPDTFVMELAQGERFKEADEIDADVPLTELQDAVPFNVLVPALVPGPGAGHMAEDAGCGMIQGAIPRLRMPLLASVHYDLGGGVMLTLRETQDPMPVRDRQKLTARGDMLVGEDRTAHPPRTNVRVERYGTHVELEGAGLSVDELAALAQTLVPLPSGEPPIVAVS